MHALDRRRLLCGLGGTLLTAPLVSLAQTLAPGRIKVAQLGVQHAHATKLNVYRQSTDYEVIGICEPDTAAREKASQLEAFRGVPWMGIDELLAQPGLEVVLVESAVRDSLRLAQRAIDAGKHVHLDKPAGHDMPAYEKLIASAREKKLLVQMGYMYRYNPAVLLLQQFLKAGWLGEVFEVHAVVGKVVDAPTRRELAEFPGGIMFELGCHFIDLVVGIIGTGSRVTVHKQRLGTDGLADNVLTIFEQPRLLATVKASALEVNGGPRRQLTVCGTRGTFHIQPLDNPVATISLDEARGDFQAGQQTKSFPKFVRYVADAADMARILRGEKASDYSFEHDLDVQRCVLASG
jgi:predicted dehydrogenase